MYFNQFKNITLDKNIELFECTDCGQIYWSAKDVCELLEIEDAELVVSGLDPDMKNEIFSRSDAEDTDLSKPPKVDVLTMKPSLIFMLDLSKTF